MLRKVFNMSEFRCGTCYWQSSKNLRHTFVTNVDRSRLRCPTRSWPSSRGNPVKFRANFPNATTFCRPYLNTSHEHLQQSQTIGTSKTGNSQKAKSTELANAGLMVKQLGRWTCYQALDMLSTAHEFNSQLLRCHVTTLGKLFTHTA